MATADEYKVFKVRKAVKFGLLSGTIAGVLAFLLLCWGVPRPLVNAGSPYYWDCRPWWRLSNWMAALFAFLFFGIGLGILAGLRPKMRKMRKRERLPQKGERQR